MSTFVKLFFVVISLLLNINAYSNCNDFVPGQVLIKFKQNQKTSNQAALKTQMKATALKTFPKLNVELWDFSGSNKKTDIKAIIEQYKNHPDVEYIEPNYIYRIPKVSFENTPFPNRSSKRTVDEPNDPEFSNQWYLHNPNNNVDINALEAWEVTTASPSVKVAILDSGIDWTHEDLVNNIWQNLGEDTDGDGVLEYKDGVWQFDEDDIDTLDNDNNGYVNDFIGWDFLNNDNNPMDDTDNSHGTQVAGIIGATGNNNLGIAGVSWNLEMAALKIFGVQGAASCSQIIAAVDYSVEMGFPISNNSWGGGTCDGESKTLSDAIENALNNAQLFIASSGNIVNNNDNSPYFPASYDFDNIIAVAAITNSGILEPSSNYGATQVDIAAPGQTIRSTARNNNYRNFGLTSSAAPQVTAACALIKYIHPEFSFIQIKNAILNSATITEELFDKVATNGRLNLNAALNYSNNITPLCRIKDSLVLRKIYNSMNGVFWNNSWNINLAITQWNGVTLDNNQCVSSLNLSSRNLSGEIPIEIGNFTNITSINLSNNQITGSLPIELGKLQTLNTLNIQSNNLSGIIPPELYFLQNLEILNLSGNQLNGDIEPGIANLTNLENLRLNGNNLTGGIPPELGNLNLSVLLLHNNELGGNIPAALSNLANSLSNLQLQNNQLTGCYEGDLSALCNVNTISISEGNSFDATWNAFCQSGVGSCGSCQITDEAVLFALYNATNGPNWTNTWNLNETVDNWYGVTLDDNGCVTELNLFFNQLSGSIPSQIGNLSKLKVLKLWANDLSGQIPSSIGNLTNLEELVLSSNDLTGTIPNTIGDLTNLRELRLNSNNLSGSIPSQINSLYNLTVLNLDNNSFSGSIPPAFGGLVNLELLSLSNNSLTGNIPAVLGDLEELHTLILSFNSLSGTIPKEIGNICELQFLGLNSNQLNGVIPPEIGSLKNLLELGLDNNQLTGPIPFEFCDLFEIFYINLSNNQLTGIMPPCLSNLQNITTLIINDNQLSGCYDDDLLPLCGRLISQLFSGNTDISNGNNFTVPWEEFCDNSSGICDLVWPGDFNDDGRVTENDVLFWGLAHGNTGPVRPNANSSWIGQEVPVWNQVVMGVNGRHQDGDGSGLVEGNDLQVLEANFGETRTSEIQFVPNSSNTIITKRIYGNSLNAEYELFLQSPNGGNVATHGVALSIDFGDFKVDEVQVETDVSCITPQEIFEYLETEKNVFHLALTKIDKENEFCGTNTPFAKVIILVENIPTGGESFKMDINGQSIKSNATIEGIGNISVEDNYPTADGNSSLNVGLIVNHTKCEISGTTLGSIKVSTVLNSSEYTYLWNTGATTNTISNLTPGYYEVTATDALGNSATESAEVQGQFIPQFDENGNLITCDYSCPTLLTLDNSNQNGTFKAGSAITSKAAINAGNNVTFKAEDRIMLRNGFKVPTNTTFKAIIEDCQ